MLHSSRQWMHFMRVPGVRARMISQTAAFLNWGMDGDRGLPRIPRRRGSGGGFPAILKQPGARLAINRWWAAARTVNWLAGTGRNIG